MDPVFLYLTLYNNTTGFPKKQLGTLSSKDGNGNENVEKTTYKENNNLARASPFFVLFFPVFARYDVKMPNFAF